MVNSCMAAGAGAGVDLLQSDHIWTNSYKSSPANNLNVDKIGITIGISQVFDGGGSIYHALRDTLLLLAPGSGGGEFQGLSFAFLPTITCTLQINVKILPSAKYTHYNHAYRNLEITRVGMWDRPRLRFLINYTIPVYYFARYATKDYTLTDLSNTDLLSHRSGD